MAFSEDVKSSSSATSSLCPLSCCWALNEYLDCHRASERAGFSTPACSFMKARWAYPPSFSGADQYTPREVVDTTVTLRPEGEEGGRRLGVTARLDAGSALPATSWVTEMLPAKCDDQREA